MSLAQQRTAAEPQDARRARTGAWLLALSPLLLVAWMAAAIAVMAGAGVTDSADLTPEQMASARAGWSVIWPFYGAAVIVGCLGMVLVNRMLRATSEHRWSVASDALCWFSAAAIVANVVLSEVAGGFTETRLGDNGAFRASLVASYASVWATAVAVILTCVALRRSGMLRRTGPVLAIVAGVFLLLDVLTRGLPPFVIALLWLALGVALLRRRVPSAV